MRRRWLNAAWPTWLALIACVPASVVACRRAANPAAVSPATVGAVCGSVRTAAGTPVGLAEVWWDGHSRGTLTDSSGRFHLDSLAPGRQAIRIVAARHHHVVDTVDIRAAGEAVLHARLGPETPDAVPSRPPPAPAAPPLPPCPAD